MTTELIGLIILILVVLIIATIYLFTPTFRLMKETMKEETHLATTIKEKVE